MDLNSQRNRFKFTWSMHTLIYVHLRVIDILLLYYGDRHAINFPQNMAKRFIVFRIIDLGATAKQIACMQSWTQPHCHTVMHSNDAWFSSSRKSDNKKAIKRISLEFCTARPKALAPKRIMDHWHNAGPEHNLASFSICVFFSPVWPVTCSFPEFTR